MIREMTGNILEAKVEALVNPVNTVGVMGAGLALQFKHKYPKMFREYAGYCRSGELRTGIVIAHPTGTNPKYVVSFPTKQDWREPSRLDWVAQGLIGLRETIETLEIKSVAIPPLGCGLGGLDWVDVRKLIEERFRDSPDIDVVLYVSRAARRVDS